MLNDPSPDFAPRESPPSQPARGSSRLPLLLLVLVGILVLAFVPALMERIQYRRTLGEVRALEETLPGMNLKVLGKAFNLVYRKVKPSVVHISTTRPARQSRQHPFGMLQGRPQHPEAQGQASGVIVDTAGYIITNLHVIDSADSIDVQLSDGRSFTAEIIGGDPGIDLAVLKINAEGLTAAKWGNSDQLEVGEMVWAIGNPFGLDQTITAGIVSAKERRGLGNSIYQEFLQTDVAINPGNSGGPLVDINGDVVGINTAIVGPFYQGISFAIPSNLALEVYTKIRETGKVIRGYLGVLLEPGSPAIARRFNLPLDPPLAAVVTEITPNSPAAQAGIRVGDAIIEWDGVPVADKDTLTLTIARTSVGERVPVKILREGQEVDLDVIVGERPAMLR